MRRLKALLGIRPKASTAAVPTYSPDTLAAIKALTRALKNHPTAAVEIGSALSNLYRLRGELDQAVNVRETLLAQAGLSTVDKAEIYLELGRDYARIGLLDRAREAFLQCRESGGDDRALQLELAAVHARCGDFLEAAHCYHRLNLLPQAAHYLVRAATASDRPDPGLVREARELYPPSPEAWLESVTLAVNREDWPEALSALDQGLSMVDRDMGFLLLDPLFERDNDSGLLSAEHVDALQAILNRQPPSLPLSYSAGCCLRAHDRPDEAILWQEKALLVDDSFWPARLELLIMALPGQNMTPVFDQQLDFLLRRALQVKRFVCGRCGLKRSRIFFRCPRCLAWHSITFRRLLTD
jgi:tetratricopeptide (TPR) repeat protein